MLLKNILNFKLLIFFFFIILFCWIGFHLYAFDKQGHGFILGDWLVNYHDGGFKRRGLSGSLFFIIQDITGIKLIVLIYGAQMALYFTFFLLFLKILYKKKITLLYFTLLISPLTFFIYFSPIDGVGRKEILIFNIFALYIYLINTNKLTTLKQYLIYFLLFIATLFHEITIFYIPYFILAHFLICQKPDLKKYLLFFLSCFIPVLILFIFGAKTNEGATLSILASRGIVLTPHSILSFTNDLFYHLPLYRNNPIGYSLYLLSFFLGLFHFRFYINNETNLDYKKISLYFILIVIYSLPLFVLACDWGRWIQIHFMLLFLILTINLPNTEREGFWKKSTLILNKKSLSYLIFVPLLLIWKVPRYGAGFWLRGLDDWLMMLSKIVLS